MTSLLELQHLMADALKIEKAAEVNCEKLLSEFKLNGSHDMVEHIKNDEIHHQAMVEKLISFLEYIPKQ